MGKCVTNLLETALTTIGRHMRGGALAILQCKAHTPKAEEGISGKNVQGVCLL